MLSLVGAYWPLVTNFLFNFWNGAGKGTRTLTVLPPADFESAASTNSAIPAEVHYVRISVLLANVLKIMHSLLTMRVCNYNLFSKG